MSVPRNDGAKYQSLLVRFCTSLFLCSSMSILETSVFHRLIRPLRLKLRNRLFRLFRLHHQVPPRILIPFDGCLLRRRHVLFQLPFMVLNHLRDLFINLNTGTRLVDILSLIDNLLPNHEWHRTVLQDQANYFESRLDRVEPIMHHRSVFIMITTSFRFLSSQSFLKMKVRYIDSAVRDIDDPM